MATEKESARSDGPNLVDFDSFRHELDDIRESIQSRAFELFEAREKRADGEMLVDWMQAKSDLFERAPIELRETDSTYEVGAEIPQGFSAEDLEVSMNDQKVFIRGRTERRSESEEENGNTLYSELETREMFREISIPGSVDRDRVTSRLEGGTLTVELPKAE